jgi:hypothetical protein
MFYPGSQRILKQPHWSSIGFSGVERRMLLRKREPLRGYSALQKNRRFARSEARNNKGRGPRHLVESENRFAFFCVTGLHKNRRIPDDPR